MSVDMRLKKRHLAYSNIEPKSSEKHLAVSAMCNFILFFCWPIILVAVFAQFLIESSYFYLYAYACNSFFFLLPKNLKYFSYTTTGNRGVLPDTVW